MEKRLGSGAFPGLRRAVASWTDTPVHVIDFEGSRASGILEYGVVTLRGGAVAAVATRTCRATGRVAPEDTAVHGLDASAVAGAAPFAEEWERFARLRETGPLAAHFAAAENSLLKSVWPYPRSAPDFSGRGGSVVDWGPWIDTGRLAPQLRPGLASSRLEDVVAALGLQAELDAAAVGACPRGRCRYHAAPYDALAAALVLRALLAGTEYAGATIPWLLQLSTLDGGRRDALRQGDLF